MLPLNPPVPFVFWLGRSCFCSRCGSTGNSSNKSKRKSGDLHLGGHGQHSDCHYVLSFNYDGTICCHKNEKSPPVQFRTNYRTIPEGYVSNWHGSYHWIQCGRHGVCFSCAPGTSCAPSTGNLPNNCGPNVAHLLCGSIRPTLASSKVLLCVRHCPKTTN
jgi:hypothetical protein